MAEPPTYREERRIIRRLRERSARRRKFTGSDGRAEYLDRTEVTFDTSVLEVELEHEAWQPSHVHCGSLFGQYGGDGWRIRFWLGRHPDTLEMRSWEVGAGVSYW